MGNTTSYDLMKTLEKGQKPKKGDSTNSKPQVGQGRMDLSIQGLAEVSAHLDWRCVVAYIFILICNCQPCFKQDRLSCNGNSSIISNY